MVHSKHWDMLYLATFRDRHSDFPMQWPGSGHVCPHGAQFCFPGECREAGADPDPLKYHQLLKPRAQPLGTALRGTVCVCKACPTFPPQP